MMQISTVALVLCMIMLIAGGCAATTGTSEFDQEHTTEHSAEKGLLVLNKGEATAFLIDPSTGDRKAQMSTGTGPHEVAVSPDGRRAVVTDYGDQQTVGATLTIIELATPEHQARTLALEGYERPHGVQFLPGGRRVAVTAETDSAVVVVDLDAGAVAFSAPTGQALSHMLVLSPDARYAYTANIASGSVSKVDLQAQRVVKIAKVGPFAEAIALRPGGAEVWTASQETGRVTVLDAASLEEIGSVALDGRPIRIAFTPDGRRALVTSVASSELHILDASARERSATVAFPVDELNANAAAASGPAGPSALPIGVTLSPDGRTAYVALMGRDQVAVVDLSSLTVSRWIDVGSMPDGIAYVPR